MHAYLKHFTSCTCIAVLKLLSVQSYFALLNVTTFPGHEVKLTMATYGKVKAFNLKADDWEVYEEQLRFYMVANNITDTTKVKQTWLLV